MKTNKHNVSGRLTESILKSTQQGWSRGSEERLVSLQSTHTVSFTGTLTTAGLLHAPFCFNKITWQEPILHTHTHHRSALVVQVIRPLTQEVKAGWKPSSRPGRLHSEFTKNNRATHETLPQNKTHHSGWVLAWQHKALTQPLALQINHQPLILTPSHLTREGKHQHPVHLRPL